MISNGFPIIDVLAALFTLGYLVELVLGNTIRRWVSGTYASTVNELAYISRYRFSSPVKHSLLNQHVHRRAA